MRINCVPNNSQERCQCIIDAMEEQVIEKGFHKASMNQIAKSAGLSVGQIYRYFAHKNDIICALVEQNTQKRLQFMASFLDKKDWLTRHFCEENHKMRIINLEIHAEAARNKIVDNICQQADQRLQQHAINLMQSRHPFMSKQEVIARLEMLVTFAEGLLVRWNYQAHPFSEEMHYLYNQILDQILPDEETKGL